MPQKAKRPFPKLQVPQVDQPQHQDVNPPVDLDDKFAMTIEGVEYEVKAENLEKIQELGRGAYGVVETMRHPPSGFVMAVKRIHTPVVEQEKRRMKNEVSASKRSEDCQFMVRFYGAMFREGDVWICMEVMDLSLDKLINMCCDQKRQIPERILGKIAYSVVMALNYMKVELELMHRDVKPSNVLVDKAGHVKICDYGISGHLTNSLAKTIQAGCKPYMAPERVHPQTDTREKGFDIRSDVWSLGITMLELAMRRHPYDKFKTPFEQLREVVEKEPPTLPPKEGYSDDFADFMHKCLMKDYQQRPKYDELLAHPFIKNNKDVPDTDVAGYIESVQAGAAQSERALQDMMQRLGQIQGPETPSNDTPPVDEDGFVVYPTTASDTTVTGGPSTTPRPEGFSGDS